MKFPSYSSSFKVTLCGLAIAGAAVLNGCGIGSMAAPSVDSSASPLAVQGTIHGGQQGVVGSTIQLYTVGSGGNGTAAIPMLTSPVTSGAGGAFSITGKYTCGFDASGNPITGGSNQVYIVATGGNPGGLPNGSSNAALAMMAALGPCSSLTAATYIFIDEVTTVAAAWALAPFMTSYTNIAASSTNSAGITNAFLNAQLLANTSTGNAATLASNLTIEQGKLYSLANALAACINSDGTSACTPLFTASTVGVTAPTNTIAAALNIVKHPGQNVVPVFQCILPQSPYAGGLSMAPNDWTMSLTVTGGGLQTPTALAIDAQNNVWVAGEAGPLSGFGPQGTPLAASGFGAGSIKQAYGMTIDSVGDIWVTNYNAPYNSPGAVTKFLGSTSNSPGTVVTGTNGNPGFYDGSIQYPYAVSADTNGNIFIANNGSSSATVYDSNGNLVAPSLGQSTGLYAFPQAIAADSSHGFWLSDSDNTVAHISSAGALLGYVSCCSQSYGLATDSQGNVWVADYLGGSASQGAFAEVNGTTNVPTISGSTVGGVYYPAGVVIDAAQNVWFSNFHGQSITEIQGNGGGGTPGAAISPTTGVYGFGGYGRDAGLSEPFGIGVDRGGNVWVSNEGLTAVMMFFGLATPTATPIAPVPTAP